jgi:hypothetical protein
MDLTTILISVLVAAAVVAGAYFYFSRAGLLSTSTVIHSSAEDGRKSYTSKKALPRSKDQYEGLTFSYTCWVKIDDFSYRYGQPKVIFVKGSPDLSSMCPALLVDGNTNSFLVKVDTFGGTETIPIANIPAKKWIHVAIAVDQEAINVYINGNIYIHHSITHMPKQNNSTVSTGVGGGFDGKLANLEYYGYLLTPDTVKASMANPPSGEQAEEVLPPYFDISWWTGRRG